MYICRIDRKDPVRSLTDAKVRQYKNRLKKIENSLNSTKSLLDKPYKENPAAGTLMSYLEAMRDERSTIAHKTRNYNISNAWIKAYEIYSEFKLITKDTLHFDNAAFPGSFMLAAHHYSKTIIRGSYEWVASSLVSRDIHKQNLYIGHPLGDKYGLYRNYRDHWLMKGSNDGDVLDLKNIQDWEKVGCNLYTSDLGFDVSNDYNAQEKVHAPANLGQVLAGLVSMRDGGNFCTKQYTMFQPLTISIIWVLASVFREFYICKPIASKEDNSETYLVGKYYKRNKHTIKLFKDMLRTYKRSKNDFYQNPIIPLNEMSGEFLNTVIRCNQELARRQIKKIKLNLSVYNKVKNIPTSEAKYRIKELMNNYNKDIVKHFYKHYTFKPINHKYLFYMRDIFRQKNL